MMPKRVGASAQPCFTLLLIGKGSEVEPSSWNSYTSITFTSLTAAGLAPSIERLTAEWKVRFPRPEQHTRSKITEK